jgi:hypothetical protein
MVMRLAAGMSVRKSCTLRMVVDRGRLSRRVRLAALDG